MSRKSKERLYFLLFRLCAVIVIAMLAVIIIFIVQGGIGVISWAFLTTPPKEANTAGGVLTPLIGSVYLIIIVFLVSVPIGVLSAVYLVEYQKNPVFTSASRVVVDNLAGVPSIVWGLLGLGLFVSFFALGSNLLSAGLTLSLLALPIIISASREALLAVPDSVREASLALGASKWETIRHHTLVYSLPGITTGVILSLSRAIGETAPILLTGAYFYVAGPPTSVFDKFTALPFQIYAVSTQTDIGLSSGIVFGTAIVLLFLVLMMNMAAFVIRRRYRDRYRW